MVHFIILILCAVAFSTIATAQSKAIEQAHS